MSPVQALSLWTRHNRGTAWMLIFISLFYSIFILSNFFSNGSEIPSLAKAQTGKMTAEDMKEKEAAFLKNIEAKPDALRLLTLSVFFVLVAGIGIDFYLLTKKLSGRPLIQQTGLQADVAWGVNEVFQLFVLLFFIETVLVGIEMAWNAFSEIGPEKKSLLLMVNSLIRDLFAAGFVILQVRRRFGEPLSDLGLTLSRFAKNITTGILGYLSILPVLIGVLIAISVLAHLFSYQPEPQMVVQIYLQETSEKHLIFFTLFVAIVGPLAEEIFFRGFTYKAFRARFGVTRGMLASAALFALMHMNFVAFLPIFFLGMFLVYLYEKTGSLVPSMTAHVAHNIIMVGLTLGFKAMSA